MPTYADVVHAAPSRVWEVLLDVPRRAAWKKFAEAAWVTGRAGTVGAVAQYAAGGRRWREMLVEVEPEKKARFEVRGGAGDEARESIEWRIQPLQSGTLLVLDVRGRNPFHTRWLRFSRGFFFRRVLRGLKADSEAGTEAKKAEEPTTEPASPVEAPPPSLPLPRKGRGKKGK